MAEASSGTVTLLFTDLVNSNELLHRAGDESAQRILRAHHALLQQAVVANGGREVKWLGDGLMVAFASAVDAVRCAIAMQQAALEPAAGEQLEIRVGLHVGEAMREEADYFGTAVVIAKRLCDRAAAGQILCSALVSGLLSGRRAFEFSDWGNLELKGIATPVATCEIRYEQQPATITAAPSPSAQATDLTAETTSGTVTLLFSDLVNSTELLQRMGDELAQRIFQAHHKLLQEAVAANGGREVRWLGDGLMVAFPSAADAVRCAVAMQQGARLPAAGEQLEIRVGLNVGEALQDEADYFGLPVAIARSLCDQAAAGQILCSALVSGLLSGRKAFSFKDLGELELSNMPAPVATCEVLYKVDQLALLTHTPFVGRAEEFATLHQKLDQARAGRGGLVMLVGEPGIGKTRMAEELAEAARSQGATLLWGRCYEGEWAPPYGPFAEAIEEYSRVADPKVLREQMGAGAGPIARLVPALRNRLPNIAEPPELQPDEERLRLLDAVSQFLIRVSMRAPLVLVLDDLHWADKGTIAMLRHVVRFASRHPTLLLCTYRDVELDRQHPLAEALGALRREPNFERISLKGLAREDVSDLLSTLGGQELPDTLAASLSSETNGNPFFIREVLLHLVDTGAIHQRDGRWVSDANTIEELSIPEGVRQAIGQRLSRLSGAANRLLTVASAFSGGFQFNVAAAVAGLEEMPALDAVDEALAAQLLRPAGEVDSYDFAHALIRHTLYTEQNPSRQVRLHRQIAEAMEATYGERATDHAAELAYQYHRSAVLPGAERGVSHALAAADKAEATYARDEAAGFLRMALELALENDARRPRLYGRLGVALAWTLAFDEALTAAGEAGDLIASAEGVGEAADYLAHAARTMHNAGFIRGAWALAAVGLGYAGERRDATWAWLMEYELMRREAEDPDDPGIPLDTSAHRELAGVIEELPPEQRPRFASSYSSRKDVLIRGGDNDPVALSYLAGEYRRGAELWQARASLHEQQGQIANAVSDWAQVARCHNALGDFAAARKAFDRGMALVGRLSGVSPQAIQIFAARLDMDFTIDPQTKDPLAEAEPLLQQPAAENSWAAAPIRATAALGYAWLGREENALRWLDTLVTPLERAPAWAPNYTVMACLAASALWVLERTDHIELIERNLREKVVEPDFRFPMQDGRLSMARLCALQGRYDEAADWFAQARTVLDEQGARPLHAIVDLDEAQMYLRRAAAGDHELARPLLAAAREQFRSLGMTGWLQRAEQLAV